MERFTVNGFSEFRPEFPASCKQIQFQICIQLNPAQSHSYHNEIEHLSGQMGNDWTINIINLEERKRVIKVLDVMAKAKLAPLSVFR